MFNRLNFKNIKMKIEDTKKSTQKITDFTDKSLLIVDDDNPLRDRLARAMEKKGFDVIQAESVKKGISEAQKRSPAFAVVDLRLGDGSGLEVIKEIRKFKKDSRVVMLTGYGNIPTAVAAVKHGAIDYLAKPADAEDVEKALFDGYAGSFPGSCIGRFVWPRPRCCGRAGATR